jgi:lipid-binding SYLF domain-containing protein
MSAKILAYSRSRGLFAGLVVKGGVPAGQGRQSDSLRKPTSPREVLLEGNPEPAIRDGQILIDELNKTSPTKVKDQTTDSPKALSSAPAFLECRRLGR